MSDEKPRRRSLFGSLNRFISNINPVFPDDPQSAIDQDADLSPSERDHVFAYQLTQPDPRRLGTDAFQHGGIAASAGMSARIHAALCAASILSTHDADTRVYTARISRKLPSQVPWISVHAQRKLVGLLFFWEEELVRWGMVDEAAAAETAGYESMREAVRAGAASVGNSPDSAQGLWEQHRLALARLEASRRQLPSKRDEAGNRVGMSPGLGAMPPAYGDNISTVGVLTSPSRETTPMWGRGMPGGPGSIRGQDADEGGLGEPAMPIPTPSEKGGPSRQ